MSILDLFRSRRNEIKEVRPHPQPPRAVTLSSNQVVRVVQTVRTAAVPSTPRNNIYIVLPKNYPNIPVIVRKVSGVHGIDALLVECKPQIRKVYVQLNGEQKSVYYLAYPWLYFLIFLFHEQFAGLFHFFSNSIINGQNNVLGKPPLPNTYSNSMVCFGHDDDILDLNFRMLNIANIQGKILEILKDYWVGTYTDHLINTNYVPWGQLDHRFSSFSAWQEASKRNPDFILKVNWARRPAGSVDYILKNSLREQ